MLRAGRAAKPAQGGSGEGRGGPWRAVAALVGLPVGAGRRARQGGSAGLTRRRSGRWASAGRRRVPCST